MVLKKKKKVGRHFKLMKFDSESAKSEMKERTSLCSDSILGQFPKWTKDK